MLRHPPSVSSVCLCTDYEPCPFAGGSGNHAIVQNHARAAVSLHQIFQTALRKRGKFFSGAVLREEISYSISNSIEVIAKILLSVIPAKAGMTEVIVFKENWIPRSSRGMTNLGLLQLPLYTINYCAIEV